MANTNDAWVKVLEERVTELKQKLDAHKRNVEKAVKSFKEWVNTADDIDIIYDSEYRAERIKKSKEAYTAVWHEFKKAEAELEDYKEAMGL